MKSSEKTFLTAPVIIAPTCKTVAEAKRALAGVLKQIEDNTFAIEKALNIAARLKRDCDALKTQTPADMVQEIERKREDLAAAIALGEKSSVDLEAFEKEIKLAEKSRDKAASLAERIKPLEIELRGLRRRVDVLTAESVRLQEERRIAAVDLCEANYEALGVEYLRVANELRLVAAKAVAWGDLHKNPRLKGTNDVGKVIEETSLMPLGTKSTHNRTPSFSNNEMRPLYIAADEEVLAGLAADGLELFPSPPPKVAVTPPRKVREQEEKIPVSIVRPVDDRFPDGFVRPAKAVTD